MTEGKFDIEKEAEDIVVSYRIPEALCSPALTINEANLVDKILALCRRVREEALEEAIGVLEKIPCELSGAFPAKCPECRSLVNEIRALKPPSVSKENR